MLSSAHGSQEERRGEENKYKRKEQKEGKYGQKSNVLHTTVTRNGQCLLT